jgi:hypothetical protein
VPHRPNRARGWSSILVPLLCFLAGVVALGAIVLWALPAQLTRHPSAGMTSAERLKAVNDVRAPLVAFLVAAGARVVLGDEARGQLLVDRRHLAAAPNVTLVRRVNADGFRALLFEACGTAPGPVERLRLVMGVA